MFRKNNYNLPTQKQWTYVVGAEYVRILPTPFFVL